ncbi:MAG: benzoyl-CoA reductase subunit A [Deltaproteobacteria bacterium]|nr:benzoyl-CoA reductase subunit A [Deltaproteobacteria bacterium]
MKCVVGIDLGSTTTKAVILDEQGEMVGRGITNSRSNYEVACQVAHQEALISVRFAMLERVGAASENGTGERVKALVPAVKSAYRLELYLHGLDDLEQVIAAQMGRSLLNRGRASLEPSVKRILAMARENAPALFAANAPRRSDFFRDLAGAAYVAGAEKLAKENGEEFEPLVAAYDRAILEVETHALQQDISTVLKRAVNRVAREQKDGEPVALALVRAADQALSQPLHEVAFVGTGYGRQTLPFPREAVRSEILCHGRGAHRIFPGTRTVLDIGGQDTKAIQVDGHGVVTGFQMNDRCAAGCGRYLGYIADELNLGLHELGPLALQANTMVKVNSTCTVFAGAELRERLALGQRREDILAGLHRSIMLRAMSLLARSGGVNNEFTFTGGVCNNPMAVKVLRELVVQNYGDKIHLNIHPDSIYMGALGGALFALDDLRADKPSLLPTTWAAGAAA